MNYFEENSIELVSDVELKTKFAELMLRNVKPFEAALELFPGNNARALQVSSIWPNDQEVQELKAELLEDRGAEAFQPSKLEAANNVWERITNRKMLDEDYVKTMKLYCEIRGFIDKAGININNNVGIGVNNVMVVPSNGSDDDWGEKLINQQKRLQSDGSS